MTPVSEKARAFTLVDIGRTEGLSGTDGRAIVPTTRSREQLRKMTTRKMRTTGQAQIVTPVKGGYVTRDAKSGRFLTVQGSSGTSKSGPKSEEIVKKTSTKRREALKRLADR
jgi:hypothetical protein